LTTSIKISALTGQSPFNVYICDTFNGNCQFAVTVNSTIPPSGQITVPVPNSFQHAPAFNIKIVDSNNCIDIKTYNCITPTPTPTPACSNTLTFDIPEFQIGINYIVTYEDCCGIIKAVSGLTFGFNQIISDCVRIGTAYGNRPEIENFRYTGSTCICPVPTPTPTPTLPPVNVDNCGVFILENTPPLKLSYYDITANTLSQLSIGSLSGYGDIAHTTNKLWILNGGGVTNKIREWNITLTPFTAVFSRDIEILSPINLNSITAIDNFTLIGVNTIVPFINNVVQLDITTTTASTTNMFNILSNRFAWQSNE
jgi:hypothetical protein